MVVGGENYERYSVPIVDSSGVASDLLDFREGAILRRPITGGPKLQVYVRLRRGAPLVAVFHGAVRKGIDTYPRFDRVSSMGKLDVSLLSFSDPTLTLHPGLELGWYLGNSEWDPLREIVTTIQEAVKLSEAPSVMLVGGSGGGFAALRAAASRPRSLAFVFSPQTVIANYIPRVVARYFECAFPGKRMEEVLAAEPSRFSMVELYGAQRPATGIYYLQNINDGAHVAGHYAPMRRAVGVAGVEGLDLSAKYRFVLFDSKRLGHGPPFADEFDWHFGAAKAQQVELLERWPVG